MLVNAFHSLDFINCLISGVGFIKFPFVPILFDLLSLCDQGQVQSPWVRKLILKEARRSMYNYNSASWPQL